MIGAVDIGGTKIAVGVVDDNGKVLARAETPTDSDNYAAGVDAIASMLRQTEKDSGAKLRGIGIGSTGPIDPFAASLATLIFSLDGAGRVWFAIWRMALNYVLLSRMMATRPRCLS